MFDAIIEYNFMQNAVISALLASVVCGIIGTIIVEKKMVMMSGGIAHASFGGIGLGYFLGIEPILGALLFSLISALGISSIRRKTNTNSDALIGMFWSVGMAIGILFVAFMPGYPPDMTSYLFGDILTVSDRYINIMLVLDAIIVLCFTSLFNYWKAYLFDEEFIQVLGISAPLLEKVLFILIAMTIVVLIKIVGIILVIALLTVPPAIVKLFTYNLGKIMLLSAVLGAVFCISGLVVSYFFDIPSGATIILISGIAYFITYSLKRK
ncbi:MAG: metal ABC transporter permease [Clostridia bacterium]|nr:metal ABC transporter permease [Clostridia bacterium]